MHVVHVPFATREGDMGFEGYDSWKATDARVEREEPDYEYDEAPLYRVMFSYQGYGNTGFVRARWERLDGKGLCSRWTLVCSGRGAEERDAIAALRDNLRVLRKLRAEHQPMGAWSVGSEVDYAVVL
jgi:hypothetical protein